MIASTEQLAGKAPQTAKTKAKPTAAPVLPPGFEPIETVTAVLSHDLNELAALVNAFDQQMQLLRDQFTPSMQRIIARIKEDRATLASEIQSAPHLFEKPRTVVLHGIKIGYAKGKGKMEIEDVEATVAKIEKTFGPDAIAYLRVVKTPDKEALAMVPAGELKKLGITLTDTGDTIVIKPVAGDLEKAAATLLAEKDGK